MLVWANGDGGARPSFCDGSNVLNAPATCPLFQTFLTSAAACNYTLANSLHFGGIPVCMADGSVHMVADSVSAQTWGYACDPQDGNVLGTDWN